MNLNETNTAVRVSELTRATQDAYSFDRYGEKEWAAATEVLVRAGYSDADVEWILRSKHMRWAADAGEEHNYESGETALNGKKIMNEYLAKKKGHIDKNLADPDR